MPRTGKTSIYFLYVMKYVPRTGARTSNCFVGKRLMQESVKFAATGAGPVKVYFVAKNWCKDQ